jgi:hypothetical protein
LRPSSRPVDPPIRAGMSDLLRVPSLLLDLALRFWS